MFCICSCSCSCRSIYLSILSYLIFSSLILSIYLSICLSASLKTKLFCETAAVFELDNIRSATIFARRPHFLNLTTSRMEQFCETFSIFEAGNIKNEAILRDFLQKWKVECRADGLLPMRFATFSIPSV